MNKHVKDTTRMAELTKNPDLPAPCDCVHIRKTLNFKKVV